MHATADSSPGFAPLPALAAGPRAAQSGGLGGMMDLSGTRVLVIGAGRTGLAVARLLDGRAARIRLADRSRDVSLEKCLSAAEAGWMDVRLGEAGEALLEGIDLVVPSPGVPRTAPELRAAVARGVPVLSEIELASQLLDVPLYAVTGTNGKSTTAELLGEMLRNDGRQVFVGGNLGPPLVEAVGAPVEVAVVEVSSYQLEWVERFRPVIGIWLNLTEDHLDRYDSLADYGATKARLFARQSRDDWAALSRDDPAVWESRRGFESRIASFGRTPGPDGARAEGDTLVVALPDVPEQRFDLSKTRLAGVHNRENLMAATLAAILAGTSQRAVQSAIDQFPGLPHRLEQLVVKNGVSWIDDSKGTNVGAVVRSLESVAAPVILLAGGVSKQGSYDTLRPLVADRVTRLVLFGAARHEMAAAFEELTSVTVVETLEEAVAETASASRPGDTVLLSPACSSFDQFRDYAERGDRFRALVEAL